MEEHFEWVKDVPETVTITKEEYDYLKWFYKEAYFGPYHDVITVNMMDEYICDGGVIPKEYLG